MPRHPRDSRASPRAHYSVASATSCAYGAYYTPSSSSHALIYPPCADARPHGGSDRFFGARLSCETKHTMQNLGVCRYGNNQQTCQNSKIHQSSRTAKSAFFPAGPRWDFSVTRGVSRAQNKLWGPLLWQPMYPTLSYNMSKCSD